MNKFEKKVKAVLEREEKLVCASTDKLFRTLMILEWITGALIAYFYSPKTWIGTQSEVHIHLLSAVFLGALILIPSLVLTTISPGESQTRYAVSCSQMLYGCLLIHLLGGRIEAHFYLFGSLAFLATYRKWKVLIPATFIVALDHIVRGLYWPESIYGIASGAEWRWVEHSFWIIFEVIFLTLSIVRGHKDQIKLAKVSVDLELKNEKIESMNKNLFSEVEKKTKEARDNESLAFHNAKLASVGALAAGVGHEINNPLAIIQGNVQIIKNLIPEKVPNREKVNSALEKVQIGIHRVSNIVLGLRTFARTDNDDSAVFELNKTIEQSILLVKEIYEKEGVSIETSLHVGPLNIFGNVGKIQQVFMNLLSNAKDAVENTKKPLIRIEISQNEDVALVKVHDNGHAIPKEIQNKIFDAFYTTKPVGKGTGIGLSLSFSIIQEHKGDIYLDSNSEGTTFVVKLPISQKKLTSKEESKFPEERKLWKGKKFLIVDDEEDLREIIEEYLKEEQCTTVGVDSGEAALEILSKGDSFDFILCDMQMSGIDGLETIEKISKLNISPLPIFGILTGGIDKEITTSYLLKPFTDKQLYKFLDVLTLKK